MLIYSQLYDDKAMADIRTMLETEPGGVSAEFDALTPDSDAATRAQIAEELAPQLAAHLNNYAWLSDPTQHLTKSPDVTSEVFVESVIALYNSAQLDVLGRASKLAQALRDPGAAAAPPTSPVASRRRGSP